jgi:hypothetical protein
MADISASRSHFESNNLPYFTFYPKSQKPLRAVIQHLMVLNPAEDISDGLVNLGFDVDSVKQMSTSRRSPAEGTTTVNIPSSTLPRMSKPHEILKLTSLCLFQSRYKHRKPRLVSRSVTTANNSATPGITASKLPNLCSVGAVTCIRNDQKRAIQH